MEVYITGVGILDVFGSSNHDLDIIGFRDTYLGRQVLSRVGIGSAGGLGSAVTSPSGVWGRAPKSNLVPF